MDETNFFEISYRIINKYNAKTKKPKYYGTEHLLYSSEIHMLEVIGGHGSLTATQIASLQGITRGAVSQTTGKLMKKGLLKKELSPAGNNEVAISLTDTGRIVYRNHLRFHQDLTSRLSQLADSLPEESVNILLEMLDTVDKALDNY